MAVRWPVSLALVKPLGQEELFPTYQQVIRAFPQLRYA